MIKMDNDELEEHSTLIDRLYITGDRIDFLLSQKYTNTILILLVIASILIVILTMSREGIITVPVFLYIALGFALGYWVFRY